MLRAAFDWVFRSRKTGKITIGQLPNLSLGIFLVAAVTRRVFHPVGTAGTVVDVVATVALVWWAVDELVRGVNPWRRALGAAVLALVLLGLATR